MSFECCSSLFCSVDIVISIPCWFTIRRYCRLISAVLRPRYANILECTDICSQIFYWAVAVCMTRQNNIPNAVHPEGRAELALIPGSSLDYYADENLCNWIIRAHLIFNHISRFISGLLILGGIFVILRLVLSQVFTQKRCVFFMCKLICKLMCKLMCTWYASCEIFSHIYFFSTELHGM